MARSNLVRSAVPLIAACCGLGWCASARATTYAGNGATGFGGPVGDGTLAITDDGVGDLTLAFTPGAIHDSLDGNNLVIYLSTGAAGLADTSTLTDDGDNGGTAATIDAGREAISGYNDGSASQGNPQTPNSRTEIAFPSGFQATYAFSFANAYDGLFRLPTLATDTPGDLIYVDGASPVDDNNTLTIPLSELGLSQGQSFSFVASLIDGTSAYRSDEAIGDATLNGTSTSLASSGNPGFNNLVTFTDSDTYASTAVPEPTGLAALLVVGSLAGYRRRQAPKH